MTSVRIGWVYYLVGFMLLLPESKSGFQCTLGGGAGEREKAVSAVYH